MIDTHHHAAVDYMIEHGVKVHKNNPGLEHSKYGMGGIPPTGDDPDFAGLHPSQLNSWANGIQRDDLRKMLRMPFGDVIRKFGTDHKMLNWLKSYKELVNIHAAELKNDEAEKLLVRRELVEVAMISYLENMQSTLLVDSPSTIYNEVKSSIEVGESKAEAEARIQTVLSKVLKLGVSKVEKALKDMGEL